MKRAGNRIYVGTIAVALLLMGRSFLQESVFVESGGQYEIQPKGPLLVDSRRATVSGAEPVLESALDFGRPVAITIGDTAPRAFLFRPQRALADDFQFTRGSNRNDRFDAMPKIYEGLATEGSARASLVTVGAALAGVIRDPSGDITYIRTHPQSGRLESRVVRAGEVNAICDADGELSEMVSLHPLKADLWVDASDVVIAAVNGTGGDTEVASSSLDHPVDPTPRGHLYELSLKEAMLVLVLDKTATGDDSLENLRSKASLYLATAANVASHFEHQLGIRILVQEMILLPDVDSQSDIPTAVDSETAVRGFQEWMETFRPIQVHRWTLAAKFGAGLRSTTLGAGVIARLSTKEAVSVQRSEALWDVLAHEMGHSMGSYHTAGGLMNRETERGASRSFFHLLEDPEAPELPPQTAAKAIHLHASAKLLGSYKLRDPEEIPWANEDELVTPVNTLARFRPLVNDDTHAPYGVENASLTLAEVSAIIPRDAGVLGLFEDEILFLPSEEFEGTARFSYSVRGSVRNDDAGWLHRGHVNVRVGEVLPPAHEITIRPGTSHPISVEEPDGELIQPAQAFVYLSRDDAHQLIIHAETGASGSDHFTYGGISYQIQYDEASPRTRPDRYVILPTTKVFRFNPLLNDGGSPSLGTVQRSVGTNDGSAVLNPVVPALRLVRVKNLTTFSGELTADLATGQLTFRPILGSGTIRISYTVEDAAGNQATDRIDIVRRSFRFEDLVPEDAPLVYQVPSSDRDGETWMLPSFDASAWNPGQAPLGFNVGKWVPEGLNTALTEPFPSMRTIYLRFPFHVEDPSALRELELSVDHERGGFVAYLNGHLVARHLARETPAWEMRANEPTQGQSTRLIEDISEAIPHLRPGTNLLAIHGVQQSSSGVIVTPRLSGSFADSTLAIESPLPHESRLPFGQTLVLDVSGRGQNLGTPITWWLAETPPGGSVQFTESVNGTLAEFSAPGRYVLLATAYHPVQPQSAQRVIHVGEPLVNVPSGTAVEAGDLLQLTGLLGRLDGRVATVEVDHIEWTKDDGSGKVIIQEPNRLDTAVAFTKPGVYRLRLRGSSQGVSTTDVLLVDAGRDLSIDEAPEVWFQETSSVRYDTATAKAVIVGGNKRSYRVAIYYGFVGSDRWSGLLDLGGRSVGSFRQAITGLRASEDYHYRLLIDGKYWAPSVNFRTEEAPNTGVRLLGQEAVVRYHVPRDESLDSVWMAADFDDSEWETTVNRLQVRDPDEGWIFVSNIDSQAGTSAYGRMNFHFEDLAVVRDASIRVGFEHAVVVYLNGLEIARSDFAPEKIHWKSASMQMNPRASRIDRLSLSLSEFQHLLAPGNNVLAVHSMHYEDSADGFKLTGDVSITLPRPSEHRLSEPLRGYFDWASEGMLSLTDTHLEADPDHDGHSNLMAYAGVSAPAFVNAETLVYTRRHDHALRGLSFQWESSSDLRTWEAQDVAETVTSLPNSEVEEVVVPMIRPFSHQHYWRLRVGLSPGN